MVVDIPVSHGHLEALFQDTPSPFAAAVVCHPHPLFGGTMNNNVVYRTARALRQAGAAVLRFNFRGVGRSTGTHGQGITEAEDVGAALDFLAARVPGAPLWVAGFSFGCRVGLSVGAREDRIEKLLGIGLATRMFDFSFLADCAKPKAFVQATEDEYGPASEIRALYDRMPEPKRLTFVDGTTHLFPGKLDELERALDGAVSFLRGKT